MFNVSSVFGMICDSRNSYTNTFRHNEEAIYLSTEPKYRPRTNQISVKWHHFRDHIKQYTSKIVYIKTNEKQAGIMTKPLAKP